MIQKFNKKELQRLGCTEEEINLVMTYQRKFPILLDNNENIEKFCIDARQLWNELDCPQGQFNKWIERKFKPYGFTENVDFKPFGQNSPKPQGGRPEKDYTLTIDMAKQLGMIDKKESGFLTRRYFILMENIVARNKEWLAIRDPEKEEYKKMSAEVDTWCFRIWHHHASRSEYAVEADMLNTIVTDKTSQQLKSEYGVASNDLIRDYLKKEHNEELLFLEQQNQVLLLMDMGFTERKNMLAKCMKSNLKVQKR